MDEITTEGAFKFRIKPNIEHGSAYLNRAIEELQKIIVANKASSEKFIEIIGTLEDRVKTLEDVAQEIVNG